MVYKGANARFRGIKALRTEENSEDFRDRHSQGMFWKLY